MYTDTYRRTDLALHSGWQTERRASRGWLIRRDGGKGRSPTSLRGWRQRNLERNVDLRMYIRNYSYLSIECYVYRRGTATTSSPNSGSSTGTLLIFTSLTGEGAVRKDRAFPAIFLSAVSGSPQYSCPPCCLLLLLHLLLLPEKSPPRDAYQLRLHARPRQLL